jgi:uncharacterized protein YcaQ
MIRINLFIHYLWWTRRLSKPYRLSISKLWKYSDKITRENFIKTFDKTEECFENELAEAKKEIEAQKEEIKILKSYLRKFGYTNE